MRPKLADASLPTRREDVVGHIFYILESGRKSSIVQVQYIPNKDTLFNCIQIMGFRSEFFRLRRAHHSDAEGGIWYVVELCRASHAYFLGRSDRFDSQDDSGFF